MLELTPENTSVYLHHRGWLEQHEEPRMTALAWGVSNVVLRVSRDPEGNPGRPDFVVKQSREQLRTATPWFCRLDRIYREIDVLRLLGELLPQDSVPKILFEDRENYLFGMQAAPADHTVWKQRLLAGEANPEVAAHLGRLLAQVHRDTANRDDLHLKFGDIEVFHQLRLHPFYESLAVKFPESGGYLKGLIDECRQNAHCLVLADFSPKNVLLTGPVQTSRGTELLTAEVAEVRGEEERKDPLQTGSSTGIMLVDFETGHYGDPAFDLGFFLSHLLLKAVRHHREHWKAFTDLTRVFLVNYWLELKAVQLSAAFDQANLERRLGRHLAACMWARIDGTSPVDYLPEPELRQVVRHFSRDLLTAPQSGWSEILQRLARVLAKETMSPSH